MNHIDAEEKEILDAFDRGELRRPADVPQQLEAHKRIAEATFKKDARINIRLSSRDLRALQLRALKEGMPYQTLIASVLHKFVDDQLVERSSLPESKRS